MYIVFCKLLFHFANYFFYQEAINLIDLISHNFQGQKKTFSIKKLGWKVIKIAIARPSYFI